jgi:hypothetical protein
MRLLSSRTGRSVARHRGGKDRLDIDIGVVRDAGAALALFFLRSS